MGLFAYIKNGVKYKMNQFPGAYPANRVSYNGSDVETALDELNAEIADVAVVFTPGTNISILKNNSYVKNKKVHIDLALMHSSTFSNGAVGTLGKAPSSLTYFVGTYADGNNIPVSPAYGYAGTNATLTVNKQSGASNTKILVIQGEYTTT